MVFPCRCFPLSFLLQDDDDDEHMEYETATQTKSTSNQTFYTAPSNFNPSQEKASEKGSNLRVFTFSELKAATSNFCESSKIGVGGFGVVYIGLIKSLEHPFDEIQVAVKYLSPVFQHRELAMELNVLGVVEHPNLVKLVGYCAEDDETGIHQLLVYDYMLNGSVESHLSTSSETPLSWTMRLKVAQDVARGLACLHEELYFQMILRDFTSFNILLDDQWNAKISDFWVARLGPQDRSSHVSTTVLGGMGCAAPEFIATGHFTAKCDVWSYGAFLYELITGRRLYDKNRPKNEQYLVKWVEGTRRFHKIIDPRLKGNCSLRSVQKLSFIANKCMSLHPKNRPKMSEVLEMISQLIQAPPPKSLARVVTIKMKKAFLCTKTKTNDLNVSVS